MALELVASRNDDGDIMTSSRQAVGELDRIVQQTAVRGALHNRDPHRARLLEAREIEVWTFGQVAARALPRSVHAGLARRSFKRPPPGLDRPGAGWTLDTTRAASLPGGTIASG